MKNQFTSIIIGLSIVISVAIISHAYKNRNQKQERISVTGLGTKDFKSDLIVWSGSFSKRAYELNNAYNRLDQDKQAIRNYLITKGVSASEIVFKGWTSTRILIMSMKKTDKAEEFFLVIH
jgi:hypothetical protein